jgi:hypothetical protein
MKLNKYTLYYVSYEILICADSHVSMRSLHFLEHTVGNIKLVKFIVQA